MICGGQSASPFVEKDGFRILKCDTCSVVFLDYDPDGDSLRHFYSREYFESGSDCRGYESYDECERFLTMNFERRLKRLARYVPSGPVLDVGCGYGYFLRCLGPEYEGQGSDISDHAVRIARERFALNVTAGALTETSFPQGRFSLVTLWDVVEHLPDPGRTLAIVRTVLRDDGLLALTTGDVGSVVARLCRGNWHLFTLPDHLWFFSERTLRELLDRTGFRVIELRREWCYYTLDYLVERVLKTAFRVRRRAGDILTMSRFGRLPVPVNLFDIMYVVCRRK